MSLSPVAPHHLVSLTHVPHIPLTPRRWAPLALSTLALALAACGGGGGGSSDPAPVAAQPSVRALAVNEPIGTNCPAGGARLDSGIDTNNNGVLDPSEITGTQYICNGAAGLPGAAGATGAVGPTGANGLAMLTRLEVEAAGANCAAGGTRITVGLDANSNGTLDFAEVSSTSYVCGGVPGAAGTTGATGANGTDGTNGTNGSNGLNSLMAMTAEAAGSNCTYGGTRVTSGLDTNGNSTLDAGEVTATSYNCNGAPGAGITWINVTGTSIQANPGIGYLANNAAQVTVTLPVTANIGELVEVSGLGTGGWRVAQNAGQSILTQALPANYMNW